jgi:hypothetical protein
MLCAYLLMMMPTSLIYSQLKTLFRTSGQSNGIPSSTPMP